MHQNSLVWTRQSGTLLGKGAVRVASLIGKHTRIVRRWLEGEEMVPNEEKHEGRRIDMVKDGRGNGMKLKRLRTLVDTPDRERRTMNSSPLALSLLE